METGSLLKRLRQVVSYRLDLLTLLEVVRSLFLSGDLLEP